MLGFSDRWREREYLYTFTEVCDRAGCHCVGQQVICHDYGDVLFVPQFNVHYANKCLHYCACFEEDPTFSLETAEVLSQSSSEPSVNSYQVDWAAHNAQKLREVYSGVSFSNSAPNGRSIEHSTPQSVRPNRLNGGKPCFAGQAAGWVIESFASGKCCPGYSFSPLTASQAYVNYGLPIGYIVAGVTSVGLCLRTLSG